MYSYIKMINKYYKKKQRMVPKFLWPKKKEKRKKKARDRYKNLSEEEKEKKVEYMRSYYLGHKK